MVCHKISNWSLWTMTQWRTHNAGPQNMEYKMQIGTATTNSNGDLQKEYCTISNIMTAVMQTEGHLYFTTSHTQKQTAGLWTWPATTITLTTPWSCHLIVEVETHITHCSSAGSMTQLVLWTMTQLSAHPANQEHFLYTYTVVPWCPLYRNKSLCHTTPP